MKRRIAVLGVSGSIGRQALEVIAANPDLELVAATSGSTPIDGLAPVTQVGGDATDVLEQTDPDIVLNAIVGFAGIHATLWALERGVTLALANKESLVAAGDLARDAWARGEGCCCRSTASTRRRSSSWETCLGTRSGDSSSRPAVVPSAGARATSSKTSRRRTRSRTRPGRWGRRSPIDSATLANKGLELIEAHFLFDLPYDAIEVVVHPTSVVHAIVRLRDGASLAHLGYPDMRVPISFALTHPNREPTPLQQLDFAGGLRLEFDEPDLETFPLLALAREAGERGGTFPCAFNAANEAAVQAFLEGRIRFLDIDGAVADVLARVDGATARDVGELVEADRSARNLVAVA